ncbi:unnamed protein product [Trichobilharzia regenti]|nr:unnamed protein product [Trichobilharzia regenti]
MSCRTKMGGTTCLENEKETIVSEGAIFQTWDFVMPYWLESIRTEVSRMDYPELEILLKKIFDATAGPFPFLPQKVYHFASERFFNTPVSVQDQALSWLEILTIVEVPIPMKELLTMFAAGVASLYLELLLPSSEEYDDEDDNDNVDYTDSEAEDDSLGQNTVSEADWLNEHGILSEKTLHDEDDDIGGEDHLHDGNESDVFSEEFSHSRGDDYYEYLDRNPVSTGNQFLVDENDYTEGDEDPTLDETKSLLSSIIEDKNTSKPFTSINLRKTSKQNRSKRIPPTESSSRPTTSLSVTHEDNSDKCDQSTDSKGDESTQNKLNQRKLTVEKEVKQSNESETPIIHDLPSQQQTKKQISNSPYRMTACLTHMLNIAYRQVILVFYAIN